MRLLSIITAAASLSTLSACGGGTLDAEEAQRVFQTMYMVTATVSAESATQVSTSTSTSWTKTATPSQGPSKELAFGPAPSS